MRQRVLQCTVNITLSVPKTNIIRMTIQMCNLKDIDLNQFTKDMGIEEIPTINLVDMAEVFNKKLISALDHHAPEKNQKNNNMSKKHLGLLMR